MQVLFVHPNFPAQFGPVGSRMAQDGLDCVFLSKRAEGEHGGFRCVRFAPRSGATKQTHYCSRTFENAIWHAHAAYEACRGLDWLRPDLIVGHSGFGTTAFLPELYDAPVVNLFEYYYQGHGTDMDFRAEFPPREIDYLRSRARNAMILTDLVTCRVGYSPTDWQKSLFPIEFQQKLEVCHDGIDTELWKPRGRDRVVAGERIPAGTRIVTYVSRGLEAMRGFDVFVRVAKRIAAERSDVLFVVVGEEGVHYGNDERYLDGAKSFKHKVLDREQPPLDRFRFLGRLSADDLAHVLSLSDLHIYLTVPFVLSWSMLNAMACGAVVLGSATAPVQEVLEAGSNGLLADFHDEDALVRRALEVLDDPAGHAELGNAARRTIEERYALDVCAPRLRAIFERAAGS